MASVSVLTPVASGAANPNHMLSAAPSLSSRAASMFSSSVDWARRLNTASSLKSSSLAGVHTAARAVVAATTAFKGRGVTWTAMVDRVVVGAPAAQPNDASAAAAAGGGDSTRGYLLDARVDISARYSARERRAVCVGVELDVGEVDLVEESGWTRRGGKTSSNFFEDGFSRVSSSSASASASSSS